MLKPWTITIDVNGTQHALEYPARPLDAELGADLVKLFGQYGFIFQEDLTEIRECAELSSTPMSYPSKQQ